MASVEDTVDLTSKLPDELLVKVFDCLPLLHEKLRLESVSRKFKRCILTNPQPLELNVCSNAALNGYKIEVHRLLDSLRAFAKKAKFNSIHIRIGWVGNVEAKMEQIDSILSILLLESKCLEKVDSFRINCGCSQNFLEMIIAKCPKLSTVGLDFPVSPSNGSHLWSFPMDLGAVLEGKTLTRLHLMPTDYEQDQLWLVFDSLKQNSVKILHLYFYCVQTLDLVQMAKKLSTWAALQEMNIRLEKVADVKLVGFFDSLALMPSLNKCNIYLTDYRLLPRNQLMEAMPSLFNSNISVTVKSFYSIFRDVPGCQIISKIKQLQNVHPDIEVDFVKKLEGEAEDYEYNRDPLYVDLNLSLNNILLAQGVASSLCACVDCCRFYPNVLDALIAKSFQLENVYLENYQLDRCRIGDVVDHLRSCDIQHTCLPTDATEADGLVTIRFETNPHLNPGFPYYFRYRDPPFLQFNCGRCLSSCVRCINVE